MTHADWIECEDCAGWGFMDVVYEYRADRRTVHGVECRGCNGKREIYVEG